MASLIKQLNAASTEVVVEVCVSAQHRQMLDQVLELFELRVDHDLDLMQPDQTLDQLTSRVLVGVSNLLRLRRPDIVLVHGDTTTTFATTLACFYQNIPVGHVEAGLRTGDIYSPWPEEMNRLFTGRLAALHFSPTVAAKINLEKEGIPSNKIWVTGNTVIDALHMMVAKLANNSGTLAGIEAKFPWLDNASRRMVLVTGHRRENFGEGVESLCQALIDLASRNDVDVVYPVHPNPKVSGPVHDLLGGLAGIHLLPPLDYLSFVFLMTKAYLIITDSGGIQEEAPSLGIPVLVTRTTTERPEAVTAGAVKLVGSVRKAIVEEATRLLEDHGAYQAMATNGSPYGDGHAAERIVGVLLGREDVNEFA